MGFFLGGGLGWLTGWVGLGALLCLEHLARFPGEVTSSRGIPQKRRSSCHLRTSSPRKIKMTTVRRGKRLIVVVVEGRMPGVRALLLLEFQSCRILLFMHLYHRLFGNELRLDHGLYKC